MFLIFVFLLVWLLPKFIAPKIIAGMNGTNGTTCVSGTCDNAGISALTSQIFADNLNKMKEAAISYYTDERLPKEVGQSDTMTLSDMIGKKIIVPLVDKNNQAVDVEKSYVKITKLDDEYILKVNLKDSEKEDYILVHLGCYTYCEGTLCEKQSTPVKGSKDTVVPIKGSKENGNYVPPKDPTPVVPVNPKCAYQNGKYYGRNGDVVSKSTFIDQCTSKPVVEKHYCVYYNGKYYGKNGDVVSASEYQKQCQPQPEQKYYCVKYNGNYYGKNGNIVTQSQYIAECITQPEEKHYCVYYNGKYYGKNGDVVSASEYQKQCQPQPEEKHYCVYYNGKYYGKNGDVVSASEYQKQCTTPTIEYIYEYKKTSAAKLSAWTTWSAWAKTDCATSEINCNDNDITCLKKLQILKRKEKIGTYEKTYARQRDMVIQTGSYTQKACAKYNYVEINKTVYATTTTTTYTTTNVITHKTVQSTGGWTYNGRASYSNPPADTASTHYKFVGADYSYCNETCTTLPNYYYDSYSYTGGLTKTVSKSDPTTTSNTSTGTAVSSTVIGTEASCAEYTYKTIPIYSTIKVTEKAKRTEPLYGTVCYSSSKTRSVTSAASVQTKWSYYNDTTLLNDGWVYTGVRKVK